MAHYCICKICNQKFDRDKIQAVKCGARRYAHQSCYPEGEIVPLGPEADPDLIKLKDYINTLFGEKANWAMINKQIKDYQKKGYSLSGILKSLVYFYDVKGNSIEKSNNAIGIVPFVYQDAYNYYYSLFIAQEANKNKTLLTQIKEIIIKPPKSVRPKYQFFNFEEWEEE